MQFREFINEVTQIGYQDIQAKHMFGPVYHGTTPENLQNILKNGFKTDYDVSRNGYQLVAYGNNNSVFPPPPLHHLGYGTYFTTIKAIGKQFNTGTTKGLLPFYLDVPRLETINYGSPNTMMKWWKQNGYDMQPIDTLKQQGIPHEKIIEMWRNSTKNLTNNLKSKYDAVWFKGKGITRLLDGDQVCVYDPSRIYLLNSSLNPENEYYVGDRVKIKGINATVLIKGMRNATNHREEWDTILNSKSNHYYEVKISDVVLGQLYAAYHDKLINLINNDPRYEEFLQRIATNKQVSRDDAVKHAADYLVSSSLKLNFPESLIEKKVPKGARI